MNERSCFQSVGATFTTEPRPREPEQVVVNDGSQALESRTITLPPFEKEICDSSRIPRR